MDKTALLQEFSSVVSGISQQVGLVVAPKLIKRIKHIEFILIEPGLVLAVMVAENGLVENRLLHVSKEIRPAQLQQATNYLNAFMPGNDIDTGIALVRNEIARQRAQLDSLCEQVVSSGLATWSSSARGADGTLLISGQANLLDNITGMEELEDVSKLFQGLESKENILELLEETQQAEGLQIFIGTDCRLFNQGDFSMIIASYSDAEHHIVGAIGVIGPRRMNYARIIPVVDYTANVVTRMLSSS
ncbi:MAG: HrcA family transcriptional regulator [Bacteroidota bacterium]